MKAFSRAMRDVKHLAYLPAPHIWQLTPSLTDAPSSPSHTHACGEGTQDAFASLV